MNLFTQPAPTELSLSDLLITSRFVKSRFDEIFKTCKAGQPSFVNDQKGLFSNRIYSFNLKLGSTQVHLCLKHEIYHDIDLAKLCRNHSMLFLKSSLHPAVPRYLSHACSSDGKELVAIMTWIEGERLSNRFDGLVSELASRNTLGHFISALHEFADYLRYTGFTHGDICESNILLRQDKPHFVDFSKSCPVDAAHMYKLPVGVRSSDYESVRQLEEKIVEKALSIRDNSAALGPDSLDSGVRDLMKRNGTNLDMFYSSSLWETILMLRAKSPKLLKRIVFSGSSVLCVLGLRQNRDVDAFHFASELKKHKDHINSHNYQLRYMGFEHPAEVILNSASYFIIEGAQILVPSLLYRLKSNRSPIEGRSKDIKDVEMLSKFLLLSAS